MSAEKPVIIFWFDAFYDFGSAIVFTESDFALKKKPNQNILRKENNMKKLVSIILAAMLLFALVIPAFAVNENVTITVTKPETAQADSTATTDEIYTAYLILNASETDALLAQNGVAPGDSGITYYTTAANAAKLTAYFTFADGNVEGNAVKVVTDNTLTADGSQTEALALLDALYPATGGTRTGGTQLEASSDGKTFSKSLPIGFYVIESSLGSYVVALTTDMTITQKNQYPTFTKALTNSDDAYVEIGDTVEYTITVTVPATVNQDIVIHDTLDAGLTYEGLVGEAPANVTAAADGTTFTIGKAAAGSTVTINYKAHVEETVTYSGEYKNTAYLTYSNYQSMEIEVSSKTNKIELLKYDGADTDKENLAGATFELHDSDGNAISLVGSGVSYRLADGSETGAVTQFVTTDSGNVVIDGVDSDLEYTFVEISAPTGYNRLDGGIPATKPSTDNSTVVEVANNTGTVLPSTGSFGTTIFYVIGGLLIVAAGVLLITKKRMSREG